MLKSVVLHIFCGNIIIQTFGVNKIKKQEKQNISFSTDSLNLCLLFYKRFLFPVLLNFLLIKDPDKNTV